MVSYTDASSVQAELQTTTSFSSDTLPELTTITDWIEQESGEIDNDYGVSHAETEDTVVLDYNGEERIPMAGSPIISVSQFLYNSNDIDDMVWNPKTEDTDFTVYKDRGEIVILFDNFTPKAGKKRFKINYTYGYSSTPAIIKKLATKKVALRVLNTLIHKNVHERNDGGSVSVGSINIVEPNSYGVNSYKELKEDIRELESKISTSFSVPRYDIYEEVDAGGFGFRY